MDSPNVVANNDNNGSMDLDEGDPVDPNAAAIDEHFNQIKAELDPTIESLIQMKARFDKMQGMFGMPII